LEAFLGLFLSENKGQKSSKKARSEKKNYKHNYPFRKKSYGLQKETKTTTKRKLRCNPRN
jgi:hypothetical protein